MSAAETKNVAALMAKSALNGMKTRRPAARAQPPTLMASALARTSAFACWTWARLTSAGRRAP